MTKGQFIKAYRAHVVASYPWAADEAKLDRFMASVTVTLSTERATWAWSSKGTKEVWKAIGCKGPVTLKGLRALPAETEKA